MARRATLNLNIYRGDDFDDVLGIYNAGGGIIGINGGGPNTGAKITNGNNQLLLNGQLIKSAGSAPRKFNAGDVGKVITLITGSGIADGRTITAIASDGLSATMNGNASATRDDCAIIVRAMDLSIFTINAQVRQQADASTVLFNLPILTPRRAYGILQFFIPSKHFADIAGSPAGPSYLDGSLPGVTDNLPVTGGVFDIQFVETATGRTRTPIVGKVTIDKDVTRT